MQVLLEASDPCPCQSGREYGQCCEPTVQRVFEELKSLCPEVMAASNGDKWLSMASVMVGFGPDPIPDRLEEVAQAHRQLLDACGADTPDEYDEIRADLTTLISANPGLRLAKADPDDLSAGAIDRLVTPELERRAFWYVYTLHRLFIDDPDRLVASTLALIDWVFDEPPSKSLLWTTALRATGAELYRAFVDRHFAENSRVEGTTWAEQAIFRDKLELDMPLWAFAYGVFHAGTNVREQFTSSGIFKSDWEPDNRMGPKLSVLSRRESRRLDYIADCLAEAFAKESQYFVPVLRDRVASWCYQAGYPKSRWHDEILDAAYQMKSILQGPASEERLRITIWMYLHFVGGFIEDGGFERLLSSPEPIKGFAESFAGDDPELAEHLEGVYDQFVAAAAG